MGTNPKTIAAKRTAKASGGATEHPADIAAYIAKRRNRPGRRAIPTPGSKAASEPAAEAAAEAGPVVGKSIAEYEAEEKASTAKKKAK